MWRSSRAKSRLAHARRTVIGVADPDRINFETPVAIPASIGKIQPTQVGDRQLQRIRIDDAYYDAGALSEKAQKLSGEIVAVIERIKETENMLAVLTRAKNAYIEDLKTEMVAGKSGLDFSDLFGD